MSSTTGMGTSTVHLEGFDGGRNKLPLHQDVPLLSDPVVFALRSLPNIARWLPPRREAIAFHVRRITVPKSFNYHTETQSSFVQGGVQDSPPCAHIHCVTCDPHEMQRSCNKYMNVGGEHGNQANSK